MRASRGDIAMEALRGCGCLHSKSADGDDRHQFIPAAT